MVYLAGLIGFIGGFAIGQGALYILLKSRSTDDILHNRNIRWTYGVFNWLIAGLCCWLCIVMYNLNYPSIPG
jgi:hypothetical protein